MSEIAKAYLTWLSQFSNKEKEILYISGGHLLNFRNVEAFFGSLTVSHKIKVEFHYGGSWNVSSSPDYRIVNLPHISVLFPSCPRYPGTGRESCQLLIGNTWASRPAQAPTSPARPRMMSPGEELSAPSGRNPSRGVAVSRIYEKYKI
jgi:hypothetical protein